MKRLLYYALPLLMYKMQAQTAAEVIMTINNRPVLKSEFEAVYRKNNPKGTSTDKN